MLKLLSNVEITITTKRTSVQKIERDLKAAAIVRIQNEIKSLDADTQNRINLDDVQAALQKTATFDFSKLEEEILGVKNGKLGILTAARKSEFETFCNLPLLNIETHLEQSFEKPVDEIEIEKQITSERIQTRKEQIAEIDSKIAELIREKEELEAKLAADENHLYQLNHGENVENGIVITTTDPDLQKIEHDSKSKVIDQVQSMFDSLNDEDKSKVNIDTVKKSIATADFERIQLNYLGSQSFQQLDLHDRGKVTRVIQDARTDEFYDFRKFVEKTKIKPPEIVESDTEKKDDGITAAIEISQPVISTSTEVNPSSKVILIDTKENLQKQISALYDYLEFFLIDTFDDETGEPAGIGLDPGVIEYAIESMIEEKDPSYLNELLKNDGITLQIR